MRGGPWGVIAEGAQALGSAGGLDKQAGELDKWCAALRKDGVLLISVGEGSVFRRGAQGPPAPDLFIHAARVAGAGSGAVCGGSEIRCFAGIGVAGGVSGAAGGVGSQMLPLRTDRTDGTDRDG